MKTIKKVIVTLALVVVASVCVSFVNRLCPDGYDDPTRWGCGYSMADINKMNCEKVGGAYMYGNAFSAGSCLK